MKCCANCEWSISPELEEEILKEQGYNEDDLERPHAGDCSLGMIHDENYCCNKHIYIEGMEEYKNFIFYDETYLGPGYFIISFLDEEIVKWMKIIVTSNYGFANFMIRGFEKNSYDNLDKKFRKIEFTFQKEEPAYEIVSNFAKALNEQRVYSIDHVEQGKNNLQVESWLNEATITLKKDVLGVKHATNFIDILLGDNDTCKYYNAVLEFYKELSRLSIPIAKEEDIKKLLKK